MARHRKIQIEALNLGDILENAVPHKHIIGNILLMMTAESCNGLKRDRYEDKNALLPLARGEFDIVEYHHCHMSANRGTGPNNIIIT